MATWFGCLADSTRIQLLAAVATADGDGLTVGELTRRLKVSQSTCSHHVRRLADLGLLRLHRSGTTTHVSLDRVATGRLPQAADVVLGLAVRTSKRSDAEPPAMVRPMVEADWPDITRLYDDEAAVRDVTLDMDVPRRARLDTKWLPEHSWSAITDGAAIGWASLGPVSGRPCYSGVAETSVYVAEANRRLGIGRALLEALVAGADGDGIWTLQASALIEDRPSQLLYRAVGYRTVGIRRGAVQLDGELRDIIMMERTRP